MLGRWAKVSWIDGIILILNLFFVALLILAYLSTVIPAQEVWPLAFTGLLFPFILGINLFFIVLWVIKRKIYFLLSLFIILSGYRHVENTFNLLTPETVSENGLNSVNILTYNARVFDLYNYKPGWIPDYTNRNNIFDFLREKDFDIICFQEFVHDTSGRFKTLDTIPEIISADYVHFEYSRDSRNTNFFGLATFSKYPIINKGLIKLDSRGGNFAIYSDLNINDKIVRVYNLHLESIGLNSEDYLFMEEFLNHKDQESVEKGSRRIINMLRKAYILRSAQARKVADHIKSSPYPVIVAGDFNDTPVSYVYNQISKDLQDSFHSGRGLGQTYAGSFPGFRIDYILHSPVFSSSNYTTGNQKYSDHFPVYTRIKISD